MQTKLNILVPLELNPEFSGGAIMDYWWIGVIVLVVIGVIIALLMTNKSNDGTQQTVSTSANASSNVSIGVRTNDSGEKEYYKIVDGEEQELTEEDRKNLEIAQKTASLTQQQTAMRASQSVQGINLDKIIANSTAQSNTAVASATAATN